MKKILLVTLSLILSGCSLIENVYTWERKTNEVFELQYKLDKNNQLTLLTNYIENGVNKKENLSILNYFKPCEVFDKENWVCSTLSTQERIVMKDGNLTWYYWGEVRDYKKSYRLKF